MNWQRGALADWMGDMIVYRNLEPMERRIRGLEADWQAIGLASYYVPRKTTPEFAATLMHLLRQAQSVRGMQAPLERLLFIGDTFMNDGTAARNLGQHLPMLGFIGADRLKEPARVALDGDLMVANRWTALGEFLRWAKERGFPGDERTALLVDLDKTSLGARGRNDKVIDAARVQAIRSTMQSALGDRFDEAAFRTVYEPLNQQEYHYFTADNQDYLAYICLMVIGSVCSAEELWRDLRSGALKSVEDLVRRCEARRRRMSPGLRQAQDELLRGLERQDPTPFKAFRRREYLETVARMDSLEDAADEATVLASEIVITREVASLARYMAARGALVFGISDKPDEASIPLPEDAARGYTPLHRTAMKYHGEEVV